MPESKIFLTEFGPFRGDSAVSCLRSVAEGIDGADPQHVLLSMRNNDPGLVYRGKPDWAPASASATAGRPAGSSTP